MKAGLSPGFGMLIPMLFPLAGRLVMKFGRTPASTPRVGILPALMVTVAGDAADRTSILIVFFLPPVAND